MLTCAGRVVMISGANRGIGRAVAEKLYREDYTLSLGARRSAELGEALHDWDSTRVLVYPFEASEAPAAQDWVNATVARFGRLDGLVNNAGIARHAGLEDLDETALDELWVVNVKGPLRLTHAIRRAGWNDGVRCTALCPAFVATDLTRNVTKVSREEMIAPEDFAELVATVLALPNTASVAELLVNCRFEDMV